MRKSQFTSHLERLEEAELRDELMRLYEKIPEVRTHYKMELGSESDRAKVFAAAKKEIEAKYKTKSLRKPRRPRIQKVRNVLSDLSKKAVFNYEMIDVYLFDVECALNFARKYDYFSQVLFNNINNSFSKAIDLIEQNLMADEYKTRCMKILELSRYIRELYNELKFVSAKVYNV